MTSFGAARSLPAFLDRAADVLSADRGRLAANLFVRLVLPMTGFAVIVAFAAYLAYYLSIDLGRLSLFISVLGIVAAVRLLRRHS